MRAKEDAMTEDEEHNAVDIIYGHIDALLRNGETSAICAILDWVSMREPTVVLLAYLRTTTVAVRAIGESRSRYAAKVRTTLTERDPQRVDALLAGLEG
jgi:hypothetical protein